jgi:hypothetical protein
VADLVRARLKGTDYTMGRFWAKRLKAEIIQSPTHNDDGTVRGPTSASSGRRAKPQTTAAKKAAAKKADTATTTEENE